MANTPNFALYKPNRADTSVEVDTSLADNFTKIDTELQNNKGGLTAHINDANAHTSDNIAHSDGSVRTTLDNHEERISQNTLNVTDISGRVDEIETLGLDKLAPNLEGRISTIESDVEGILAPATFDAMDQQSYTFDEYRIGYVDNKVGESTKHSMYGTKVLSMSAFPKVIPENSDTARIQRAFNEAVDGTTIIFPDVDVYEVTSMIATTKKINLLAYKAEFKTMTDGLDIIFKYTDTSGFTISGLRFNQNLKGRTTLEIARCSNFIIEKCYFTGYSKEFGYYQTDGGIRLTDCTNYKILFNTWENHGDQYTSNTADLNRCISIQGASDNGTIIGNTFNKVNQAIVHAGGRLMVLGNNFTEVKDNVLYMVGVGVSAIFTGNDVDHRYDEAIVIDYGEAIITSNKFKNVPNKVLSIGGTAITKILFNDNTIDNTDITAGQFIYWRVTTNNVDLMIVKNNTFKCPTNANSYEYFNIGNVGNLIFKDNVVDVVTQASQRMLYFTGTSAKATISRNSFKGTDASSKAIEVSTSVVSPDVLFEDNELLTCRGILTGVRVSGHAVQFNVGPYINNKPKRTHIYSTQMPDSGTWTRPCYAENTTRTVQGTAGSKYIIKGWIRLTDGTGNVLNTDWAEDRALTGT